VRTNARGTKFVRNRVEGRLIAAPMQKLRTVLGLSALALVGCTINGKSMFSLGGSSPGGTSSDPPAGAIPTSVAAPASYAWCEGMPSKYFEYGSVENALDPDPARVNAAVASIAETLCFPDETTNARKKRGEIEAARLKWMQALAMSEADWARDVPGWQGNRNGHSFGALVDPDRTLAPSQWNPVEQWIQMNGVNRADPDVLRLTEAGRIGWLGQQRCYKEQEPNAFDLLRCAEDIARFDRAKFAKEIAADTTHQPWHRMYVRLSALQVMENFDEIAAATAKLVATDKALGPALAAAKRGFTEWEAKRDERKPLLDAAIAIDDARHAERPLQGCAKGALAAFDKMLAAVPAKRFAGMHPDTNWGLYVGGFAMSALGETLEERFVLNWVGGCDELGNDPLHTRLANYRLDVRGPRAAALAAVAALAPKDPSPPKANTEPTEKREYDGAPVGIVANVSESGDSVTIEFAKRAKYDVEYCAAWVKTNRIEKIWPNGDVSWERRCTRMATSKVDPSAKPVTIAKRYATGVAKGRYVEVFGGVATVWQTKESETPLAIFGVMLKQ